MQETELLIVSFSCMFLLFLSFFFLNIELPHLSKSSSIILFFCFSCLPTPFGYVWLPCTYQCSPSWLRLPCSFLEALFTSLFLDESRGPLRALLSIATFGIGPCLTFFIIPCVFICTRFVCRIFVHPSLTQLAIVYVPRKCIPLDCLLACHTCCCLYFPSEP